MLKPFVGGKVQQQGPKGGDWGVRPFFFGGERERGADILNCSVGFWGTKGAEAKKVHKTRELRDKSPLPFFWSLPVWEKISEPSQPHTGTVDQDGVGWDWGRTEV